MVLLTLVCIIVYTREDNDANTYQGKALLNACGNIEGYRLYRVRILPLFLTNYIGRRGLACTATPGKKEEIVESLVICSQQSIK